jgi:hypothetical protein
MVSVFQAIDKAKTSHTVPFSHDENICDFFLFVFGI